MDYATLVQQKKSVYCVSLGTEKRVSHMMREDLMRMWLKQVYENVICLHEDKQKIKEGQKRVKKRISMLFKYCVTAILNVSQEVVKLKTDQFGKSFFLKI